MTQEDRINIARENHNIVRGGGYTIGDTQVVIDKPETLVFSPEQLSEIERKIGISEVTPDSQCKLVLAVYDTCTAAKVASNISKKTVAMNFANARHPGGGYINGASAQEEDICRHSNLYASLDSPAAKPYYNANRETVLLEDTDYMILSKGVSFFRDEQYALSNEIAKADVITVPAPDCSFRARGLSTNKLNEVYYNRIRKMMCLLASEGYETVILGAWGCGAFRNSAEAVAEAFRKVLFDDGLANRFHCIAFSIPSFGEKGQVNYDAFLKVLDDYIADDII